MVAKQSPLNPPDEQLDLWTDDIELPNEKDLYRVDEVMKRLKVSDQHVRNLIANGLLEFVLVNSSTEPSPSRRFIRVTGRSLARFINSRRQSA